MVARRAHNPKAGGSSPPPATTKSSSSELLFLLFRVMRPTSGLVGQFLRPPPVAETGSRNWRSGRKVRASEQREATFGNRKRGCKATAACGGYRVTKMSAACGGYSESEEGKVTSDRERLMPSRGAPITFQGNSSWRSGQLYMDFLQPNLIIDCKSITSSGVTCRSRYAERNRPKVGSWRGADRKMFSSQKRTSTPRGGRAPYGNSDRSFGYRKRQVWWGSSFGS